MLTQTINEQQAIEGVIDHFTHAWNEHDAKALSLLFAEEADFTNVFGNKSHGRIAIEQQHAPLFTTMFKMSRLIANEISIRFVDSRLACVDVKWEMSGATDPQGRPWNNRKGLMSLMMKNEDTSWSILIMHNMDLPIIPAPLN